MKGKKRVLIVLLLLAAIFLSLCACGGNSSGAPADEPAGTAADGAKSTKSVDAKEHTPPEKRLKEVRIVVGGEKVGSFVYKYNDMGKPVRLEVTGDIHESLNRRLFNYEYDAEGRLSNVKFTDNYGDTGGFFFQYGQEGDITRVMVYQDENGDGVLNEEEKPLSAPFEFTYDAEGYMLSYKSRFFEWDDRTQWTYDEAHRVIEQKESGKFASTLFTYSYDDNGNLTEECVYSFDSDVFLLGADVEPDKSEATFFQRSTYDDLQFNDEGLLTAKNGGLWDSDGYAGDESILYTYDNEKKLRLEKSHLTMYINNSYWGSETISETIYETTEFHGNNDRYKVMYYKSTYESLDEVELRCEILSDQFIFWGNSTSAKYPITDFYLPFECSIRLLPPNAPAYLHDYYISVFPGMDLSNVIDAAGTSLPSSPFFTEDGYLSRLMYRPGDYVELFYE